MSGQVVSLTDLVVSNGQTLSNALIASRDFRDADSLTLFAPGTLPETATVQVGYDEDTAGTWYPLFRSGADVALPAGKAITIELPSFRRLRISLSGAAGADRTIRITKGFWA